MKKRILALALLTVILVSAILPISAQSVSKETHLFDLADLLTEKDEFDVYSNIVNFIDEADIHIVIITDTLIHVKDWTIRGYLSDISSPDIIVLTVSLVEGSYYYNLFTYGRAHTGLSDSDVNAILDHPTVYGNLKGGNISTGIIEFINVTKEYAANIPQEQMPEEAGIDWSFLPVAILISVVSALICCGIVVARYKMKLKPTNYPLERFARLELTDRQDIFVGSFVTKRRINTGSSGGGHSGGGRSGGHRGGR